MATRGKKTETVAHPQFGFPCDVARAEGWLEGFTVGVALMSDHPRGQELWADGKTTYIRPLRLSRLNTDD